MYNDRAVKLLREWVNKKISRQCGVLTYVSRDQHSLLPAAAVLHRRKCAVSARCTSCLTSAHKCYTPTGDGRCNSELGCNAELLQGTIPGEWDKLANPLASLELNGNNLTGTHPILLTLYIILRSLLNSSTAGRLPSPFALESIFVHSILAQA